MKTVFFNVQHGDAIFIDFGNTGLVRDFGTDSASSKNYIERLAKLLQRTKKSYPSYKFEAMLCHPHCDHCSGYHFMHQVLNVGKFFEKAYIPVLDFSKYNKMSALILKIGTLYLYFISSTNAIGKRIQEWITMAPLMADLSKALLGVYDGSTFSHGSIKNEILWPPLNYPTFKQLAKNTRNDFIDWTTLEQLIDNIIKSLSREEQDKFEEIYNDLLKALQDIHLDGSENATGKYELVSSILKKIPTDKVNTLGQSLQKSLANFCKTRMIKNIDDQSIVFRLSEESLFWSDLNNGFIKKIVEKHLKNARFKLMKSAHHGSRYSSAMEKHKCFADKVVHCCGYAKSNFYGPTPEYCDVLSSRNAMSSSTDIICTDWVDNNSKWVWPTGSYYVLTKNKKNKIIL